MSIKQIAQKAGVSPATVSRVLNNPDYRCSQPGIREKIWKTAMECNYTPNEAARNLKKGAQAKKEKTCYINVLMTRRDAQQPDSFFGELLRIAESEIHNRTCILSKVWYKTLFSDDRQCRMENLDITIERMFKEAEGRCDGLIIMGKCSTQALQKLKKRFKNVVAVNRNSTNYIVDEVVCDGYKAASSAVEYLIELGHKAVGYVGECKNESRYRGYVDTLQKHGLDVLPEYIYETEHLEANGYEVMERLLMADDCPTGIYCANDIMAIGMLKCLNRHKNRYYTPAIISSDDIEAAQNIRPMLTTVHLPKEEMGKFALYLLLDRIKGGHSGCVRMELEGSLRIRESCHPADESRICEYYI